MSKSNPRAELIEARVVREEDFALEAWRARVPFPEMRRLALRPVEYGGLGYALSESALRALVKSARARHGDLSMTREERTERQAEEIDDRGRRARYDLARAHDTLAIPMPQRDEFPDRSEWIDALEIWKRAVEAAARVIESADKRLAAAQKDERDLFGLNAPTKIEAEVTTRDAVTDELNAMLARAGRAPIEVDT